MRFAILGQTEVISDGTPLSIQPIQRRLLAALLAADQRGMSVDALLTAVWEDGRAREASLKVAMSELRRKLPGRIPERSGAGYYQINLRDGDVLDLDLFRKNAYQATQARQKGELAAAVELLGQALDLWGPSPLSDLPDALRTIRDELLRERKNAQIALWELRLDLGHHEQIMAELRQALEDDDLAERVHGLLMIALHRSGERTGALQHYEKVRDLLEAQIGAIPGTWLRDLRDQIAADNLPPPGHALPHSRPVPAQLPPDVPDYTGRRHEVARLLDCLTPSPGDTGVRIAAISGPGGIGKSALAVHVAHLIRDHYPDGQLYTDLTGMSDRPRDVTEVLGEWLTALGVPSKDIPRTPAERTAMLRSLLAGRRMLLVLDDALAAQIPPLLPGTAGCAVIITSRQHIDQGAMRRIRLYPLPTGEALHLLGEIIGHGRLDAEADAATAVVHACGGFPLAVRVAGARLDAQSHWTLAYFAERLTDLDTDQLGVTAAIAADSYNALPPGARHLWRILALSGPGDFPGWVATMLLGADAEPLLEVLTAHSLITPAGTDAFGQPRHRQHLLLREYAAARLAEDITERDQAVYRLFLGWLELANLAASLIPHEPHNPPPTRLSRSLGASAQAKRLIEADPKAWFGAEIGNLLAVTRFACREQQWRTAVGIALRVHAYLFWARRTKDAEDMWRQIMKAAEAGGDARLSAEARLRMAILISRQPGGPQRALPMLDVCVSVFDEIVDRRALARSLAARAVCAQRLADEHGPFQTSELVDAALADAGRGLALARVAGDIHAQVACLRALGAVEMHRGNHEQAISRCEQAVALTETIAAASGQCAYQAYTLRQLIAAQLAADHYDLVLALCERGRDLTGPLGHDAGDASFLELAGDALAALGRSGQAADRYAAAAAQYEGEGTGHHAARCRRKLATVTRQNA